MPFIVHSSFSPIIMLLYCFNIFQILISQLRINTTIYDGVFVKKLHGDLSMIPKDAINAWHEKNPWSLDEQIEQDLVISRIITDLYLDAFIQNHLVCRGDTALQKLYFTTPHRYSTNLDLIQTSSTSLENIANYINNKLTWLEEPTYKIGDNNATLHYKFSSTTDERIKFRIKIVNTQAHQQLLGITQRHYAIKNNWYSGEASISTLHLEELLGIKTLALYQKKKGRDLLDLYLSIRELNPNPEKIIQIFDFYAENAGLFISRANFEETLFTRITSQNFLKDFYTFIPGEHKTGFEIIEAMQYIQKNLIALLPGEPWQGDLESYLSTAFQVF